MAPRDAPPGGEWHLDKKVPIAFIGALVFQAILGIWQISAMSREVGEHSRRISSLEAADSRMNDEARRISEALARLDERLLSQTAILRRMEESLARSSSTGR